MGGFVRNLLIGLVLCAGVAHAEQDPDTESAQRHFDAGAAAYDARDYAKALNEFQEAQRLKPLPAFEFNIARTLDRMERFDEAIPHYERYLASKPDDTEAAARLQELKQRRDQGLAAKSAADKAAADKAAADRAAADKLAAERASVDRENAFGHRYLIPLVVGGLTLAAGAAGAGLLGTIGSDYDKLASGPSSCRPCATSSYSGLQSRYYAGWAMIGVAGALLVTDVALWIWKAKQPKRQLARAAWGTF
jgi:tetratricopeptide (TPR) repeat protein